MRYGFVVIYCLYRELLQAANDAVTYIETAVFKVNGFCEIRRIDTPIRGLHAKSMSIISLNSIIRFCKHKP